MHRRLQPRIAFESFCVEIADGIERPVLAIDLSEGGVRISRPYFVGRTPKELQLELEIPGVDAVVWARGRTCFDQVRQVNGELWRTTGLILADAAAHDFRLVREFVNECIIEPCGPDWSLQFS
jgi:hypothetical protein